MILANIKFERVLFMTVDVINVNLFLCSLMRYLLKNTRKTSLLYYYVPSTSSFRFLFI